MTTCKNPTAEPTPRQTFGLFKLTRKDYRTDIASRDINREQFGEMMDEVYTASKNSGWDRAVAQSTAERLLANFPAK